MQRTKLRAAAPEDAAFVVDLWEAATGGALGLLFDRAALVASVARPESRQGVANVRIALQDERPVAMLLAYAADAPGTASPLRPGAEAWLAPFRRLPPPPDAWHLAGLGVLESHRRQGIGGLLLDDLARRATAGGASRLSLHSFAGNAPALAFYDRRGFAPAGRIAFPAHPGLRWPGDLLLLLKPLRG